MPEYPVIPGYRVERELGSGGMATVYLAVQEKLNREVAVKVLSPVLVADKQFAARFIQEAEIAAGMHQANIIPIFDIGQSGPHVYLVMEYLEASLKDRLKIGPMDAAEALAVLRQMAGALAYAHGEGYVHRDIKPENIMFRKDGTAMLVDFGIARAVGAATRLTKTGMSIGTPHYMSPEQARGLDLDGRSDLYALGIVFHEMLTGRVPYDAQDSVAIIFKHIQDPIPRLPMALAWCQPLLDGLMAKDRETRIPSGKRLIEMINGLEELGARASRDSGSELLRKTPRPARTTAPGVPVMKPPSRGRGKSDQVDPGKPALPAGIKVKVQSSSREDKPRRSPLLPTLGAALVVCIGILAFLLTREKNPDRSNAVSRETTSSGRTVDRATSGGAPSSHETVPTLSEVQRKKDEEFAGHLTEARRVLDRSDAEEAGRKIALAETIKAGAPEVESEQRLIADAAAVKKADESRREQARVTAEQTRKDDEAFKEASAVGTAEAMRGYLTIVASGRHRTEAVAAISELEVTEKQALEARQDDEAFATARALGKTAAYEGYLNEYPAGKHAAEAAREIARIPKIEMVLIEPGTFIMGSKKGGPDEKPPHEVVISKGFWLGKYEVSQGQWRAVMEDNPSYFKKGDDYPVEFVSWEDCQRFIKELNRRSGETYRLPTEAEWEYTCRAGSQEERYGDVDEIAWYDGNSGGSTHAVGGKKSNVLGLHDMLGNVWEWCTDWYGGYSADAIYDPGGPYSGSYRVVRGGSCRNDAQNARASLRRLDGPSFRYGSLGFRLARTK